MAFARPWRRRIAQFCLAGVFVAAVAWSIKPTRACKLADLVAPVPIGIAFAGMVSLLALVTPLRRSRTQMVTARCSGCGYDLTGNQSGICPECGQPTLQKRIERWQTQAEQLLTLDAQERYHGEERHILLSPPAEPNESFSHPWAEIDAAQRVAVPDRELIDGQTDLADLPQADVAVLGGAVAVLHHAGRHASGAGSAETACGVDRARLPGALDTIYRAVLPFRDQSAAQVATGLNGSRPLTGDAGEEAQSGTHLGRHRV